MMEYLWVLLWLLSLGFCESKWINECDLNKPKFYLRYVDDILAAFDKRKDSLDFFKVF